MLRAKDNTEDKFVVSWLDLVNLDHDFVCPSCLAKVIFVNCTLKIKHFRHKVASNCDFEPETERHIQMKKFMLEKFGWEKECLEVSLGFAKPDLFKDNIAIEVQHSPISCESFVSRTKAYSDPD